MLSLAGSLTVYAYELVSVKDFIQDMKEFKIFEQTIAQSVYGLPQSLVKILDITLMPPARRLRHSNSEAVPPKLSLPRRPPPAPRWLQARDKYEPVPPPTPLELPGVKHDGKSGGPKTDRIKVNFRIATDDDAELAFRVMREFQIIDQGAMSGLMLDIMGDLDPPLTYTVAIVNASVVPVTASDGDTNDGLDGLGGPGTQSSALCQLGSVLFYSVRAKPFSIVLAATAAVVARWL